MPHLIRRKKSLEKIFKAAKENRLYKPGEKALFSGIYDVQHDCNHNPHEVTMIAGNTFPPCRGCNSSVRFRLKLAAKHVQEEETFEEEI